MAIQIQKYMRNNELQRIVSHFLLIMKVKFNDVEVDYRFCIKHKNWLALPVMKFQAIHCITTLLLKHAQNSLAESLNRNFSTSIEALTYSFIINSCNRWLKAWSANQVLNTNGLLTDTLGAPALMPKVGHLNFPEDPHPP